jgi:hypothetical protein
MGHQGEAFHTLKLYSFITLKLHFMKSFTVLHVGGFIDVENAGVSPNAQDLLAQYLLAYFDTSEKLREDLYDLEDAPAILQEAGVLPEMPGYDEIMQLSNLCKANDVIYLRLVNRAGAPGQEQQAQPGYSFYGMYPTRETAIVAVAILLSDAYFDDIFKVAQNGYDATTAIIHSWASEFYTSYGKHVDLGEHALEDVVGHWGQQRLARFKSGDK